MDRDRKIEIEKMEMPQEMKQYATPFYLRCFLSRIFCFTGFDVVQRKIQNIIEEANTRQSGMMMMTRSFPTKIKQQVYTHKYKYIFSV